MASLQNQQNYLKFSSSKASSNLPVFLVAVEAVDDVDIDKASPSSAFQTSTSEICEVKSDVVVAGYPTPSEGWGHGGRPGSPRSRATLQGLDQRLWRQRVAKE